MEIVDIVKETKRGSVEISMLNIMECLVYLPEQDADQIIDRMKQIVKQIREEREVKHDEVQRYTSKQITTKNLSIDRAWQRILKKFCCGWSNTDQELYYGYESDRKSYSTRSRNMVKIKVSYQNAQELDRLIQILEPYILSLKMVKQKDERYLKAYIKLKLKGESNNEI